MGGAGPAGGAWSLAGAAELAAASAVFAVGARMLYNYYNGAPQKSFSYVPFKDRYDDDADVAAVDCTHPRLPTLSHQRGARNPATGLKGADTSTGLVLNALAAGPWKRDVWGVCQRSLVTTNHFDVDSFLSVWCYINRAQALQNEGVLRHMARIGDFREAFLCPDLITAHGAEDSIGFVREAYTALKLVCWINTLERRLFSAPYETKDCDAKMAWFLARFGRVLQDPESAWKDWQSEYTAVVSGFDLLSGADCMVETFPSISLAVVSAPEPLHYYSLFSHTIGCDHVLTVYDDHRYELECKYTQTVVLASRAVAPRLDMAPLAALLNQLETGMPQDVRWSSNRFTDSGPLLRLDARGETLTKAQRYGHPTDRPMYSSSIPPPKMAAIVRSFLAYGLAAAPQPRRGGFQWDELHDINTGMRWEPWSQSILSQDSAGQLDSKSFGAERALARRRNNSALSSGARTPPAGAALRHAHSGPFSLARGGSGGGSSFPGFDATGGGAGGGGSMTRAASSGVELTGRAAAGWQSAPSTVAAAAAAVASPEPQPPSLARQKSDRGASTPGAGGRAASGSGGRPPSSGGGARPGPAAANAALLQGAAKGGGGGGGGVVLPHSSSSPALPMPQTGPMPPMSAPSALLADGDIQAITASLPPLHQGAPWALAYSTARDGTSLHTLLRKAAGAAPSLLVVKDRSGGVFGAYCTEQWHMGPRFYGTGETFVFQVRPRRALYPWAQSPGVQNDFFQFVGHDGLGVGGAGHWAVFLDEELLRGSSGECATFASPCLAGREDFEVLGVELWGVH